MSRLTKSFLAQAVIAASRFVKMGTADFSAIQATGSGSPILGVSAPNVAVASGQSVDVAMDDVELVECGGVVTRGLYIESDADGKAVNAVIVAGSPKYVGGIALESGVAGELVRARIQPIAIGADGVATTDVTVTTGQLLALNATPKVLLAAPGAGFMHIVEDVQFFLDYNSAAYAGVAAGEELEVRYTDGSGQLIATIETDPFLTLTADAIRYVKPTTTAAIIPVANAAVVLRLATGEVTTGNSPLKVRIRYRTVASEL